MRKRRIIAIHETAMYICQRRDLRSSLSKAGTDNANEARDMSLTNFSLNIRLMSEVNCLVIVDFCSVFPSDAKASVPSCVCSMTSGCWQTKVQLETVVDEPLEGLMNTFSQRDFLIRVDFK